MHNSCSNNTLALEPAVPLLLDVIDALTLEPDFETFFTKAAGSIRQLLNADGSALILLDSESGTLEYQFFDGDARAVLAPLSGTRFPAEEGTAGKALREGRSIFISDYQRHPAAMPAFCKAGLKSNLLLPLVVANQALGVLAVSWFKRQNGQLQNDRVALAERIASQIAVAAHRRLLEEQLREQALTDPLTGLLNRRGIMLYLNERLSGSGSCKHPFAVILVDMDGFKKANDSGGHALGDLLLGNCARGLRNASRAGDRVGRLGGDEFVLIVECAEPDLPQLAKRFLQAVQVNYFTENRRGRLTGSIGLAYSPKDGTDVDTLLRRADIAMYEAKHAGGNDFRRYAPCMEGENSSRALAAAVHEAMENNELELWYQPIIRSRTHEVASFEALLRWCRRDGLVISAGDFMESIEHYDGNLEYRLGAWVLNEAIAQLHHWRADEMNINVHVNIAPRCFLHPQFLHDLRRLLETYPSIADSLVLEITESTVLEDLKRAKYVMEHCRALGLRIAIDDFGTGYSSLTYLKHLPLDILKIDRSFVADLHCNASDEGIVGCVINIAHTLGLTVVAEGAELATHVEVLNKLGCDEVQGFVISKPMSARMVRGWTLPKDVLTVCTPEKSGQLEHVKTA